MGTEIPKGNGDNIATVDLAPDQVDLNEINKVVTDDFNREMQEELRRKLGDPDYDAWIIGPGIIFGLRATDSTDQPAGIVYAPGPFISGWLGDPKRKYLSALQTAFSDRGISNWEFVIDEGLCDQAKKVFLPVQQYLPGPGMPTGEMPQTKRKKPGGDFQPGEPPAITVDFEDFVPGGNINQVALAACQEVSKSRKEKPDFTNLILCGARGAGKSHLLHAALKSIRGIDPTVEVFCTDGRTFQTLYSSFFAGGNGGLSVDERRLRIFKGRLLVAKILVITNIDATTSGAKGTRRELAEAIKFVLRKKGRVLISLQNPIPEDEGEGVDLFGQELYEAMRGIQTFRVEKISPEWYPDVAKVFLARHSTRALTAKGSEPDDSLRPQVVDWVVKRTLDLSLLLSRLGTVSFLQGSGVNGHRVTLKEAQELLRLPPSADDLISLILERDPDLRRESREQRIIPEPVLDLACYLAEAVVGLDPEQIADWFYSGTLRPIDRVAGGVLRIKGALEQSEGGQSKIARHQLGGLVEQLLKRFALPAKERGEWSLRLREWSPPVPAKKKNRRRCHSRKS